MQQLLDQVSALNTLTPLENPGDITAYDLDGPDRTLEVKNDDGTGLSLQIGAAAEGRRLLYVPGRRYHQNLCGAGCAGAAYGPEYL